MIIEKPDEFVDVVDLVHDLWFDIEGIVFDVDDSRVDIRLEKRIADFRKSDKYILLVLKGVESFRVQDAERVQFYDINEICFDPERNRISITGGIPVLLEFDVMYLCVEIRGAAGW